MKYAITGNNGYVGGAISRFFSDRGVEILELRRNKNNPSSAQNVIPYSLGDSLSDPRLIGSDCLIHCAYDFSPQKWSDIQDINIRGTERLFASARSLGVKKIVLISSISAFENSASLYGRAKLEMERIAQEYEAIIIRPGLVFGDSPGGMVGTLSRFIEKLPVVPQIGGAQEMFLVHQDDLSALIEKALAASDATSQPLFACNTAPIRFRDILRQLARKQKHTRIFIPIPWRGAWIGLKLLESLGFSAGIKSDSLISLMNPNPSPDFRITETLGVHFRELV